MRASLCVCGDVIAKDGVRRMRKVPRHWAMIIVDCPACHRRWIITRKGSVPHPDQSAPSGGLQYVTDSNGCNDGHCQ